MECLEAIAWKGGGGQVSSLASVEQAKEEEDNSENDDYIEIVTPDTAGPVGVIIRGIIRGRGSCGHR